MTGTLDIHDVAWPLLDAVAGVNAYDAEVPDTPPLDDDKRVAAYAVLYLFPGRLHSLTLEGTQDSLDSTFQVTCVAGDPTRLWWCVDQVRGALVGATVTLGGRDYEIRASDTNPPARPPDERVQPPRHQAHVLFSLFVP